MGENYVSSFAGGGNQDLIYYFLYVENLCVCIHPLTFLLSQVVDINVAMETKYQLLFNY